MCKSSYTGVTSQEAKHPNYDRTVFAPAPWRDMKRAFGVGDIAALGLLTGACGGANPTPSAENSQAEGSPTEEPTMNEPPTSGAPTAQPGEWQILFDGTATGGLRGYGMGGFPSDRWAVDGGALGTIPGPGTDLITRDSYADFELEFEWRVAPGGNSGVMYRVDETAEPAWTTGPEYQVLDDDLHPDGRDPTTSAAALYDLIAPAEDKRLEPVGTFNRGRIVVDDGRVEHWLNGELVVAYAWDDPAVRTLVAASKFATFEGFMAADSGHIVFQHHGEEAAFRNVRIRSLGS
jgi:hypothetical protein